MHCQLQVFDANGHSVPWLLGQAQSPRPVAYLQLVRRGGVEVDMLNNARLFNYGGVMPRGESDVKVGGQATVLLTLPHLTSCRCVKPSCTSSTQVVGASRHLYSSTIQDAVLTHNAPWLDVHDGCRVVDLLWSDDKSSVIGTHGSSGI